MSKQLFIILAIFFTINLFSQEGVYKDSRDGNTYKIVKVGDKIWMKENLKFKAKDNESASNIEDSKRYTFNQAYKACPKGWHLPDKEEWSVINRQNSYKLMLNKYGFVKESGKSAKKGKKGYYWTSTSKKTDKANIAVYSDSEVSGKDKWKDFKLSVRCVSDKSDFELYDNFTVNSNKYEGKTKSELNKLLKETLAKENYDEASLIKEEIAKKTITEKYANKTDNELNNLIKASISAEDYEKAEKIQTIIDRRKNLSSDLTIVELKVLEKEALKVEDYERADKIKKIITKKSGTNFNNDSLKNINLPKYVGQKYGAKKIYANICYHTATGRLGKKVEDGGWGGKSGIGFNIGMQIPAFRNFFKNRKSLNGGFDFALTYSEVAMYWNQNYTSTEAFYEYDDNSDSYKTVNNEVTHYDEMKSFSAFSFSGNKALIAFGFNGGGFLTYNIENTYIYIDVIYKLGLSYTSFEYDDWVFDYSMQAFAFRKYLSANIRYKRYFINLGYEWGRTFNTKIHRGGGGVVPYDYENQKVPTGMFGISIGIMY